MKEHEYDIIYKIDCTNCDKHYTKYSGRALHLCMHKHKLAVMQYDRLSVVSVYADNVFD